MRDLAVREDVADVRRERAGEREREPVEVRVPRDVGNRSKPRDPSDRDRRDERERARKDDEDDEVLRLMLAMVGEQAERAVRPAAHMRPGGFEPPTRGLEVRRSV